jgi:uncharacterized protein YjiS (DUF1127 family)
MFRLIRQLAGKELGEWRRLADIRALEKLSDHQLADIGLRRDQLFTIEAEPRDDDRNRPRREPIYRPGFEPCG